MVMTQWDIVGGEFVASAVKATQYPQDTVDEVAFIGDRKSTRLNSSHEIPSRMPSSA